MLQSLKRTAFQSGSDPDKALSQAFKRIGLLCDNLGLVKSVYHTACELYKKVHEAGVVRGRAIASVIPAVVFIACSKEQAPSTALSQPQHAFPVQAPKGRAGLKACRWPAQEPSRRS